MNSHYIVLVEGKIYLAIMAWDVNTLLQLCVNDDAYKMRSKTPVHQDHTFDEQCIDKLVTIDSTTVYN